MTARVFNYEKAHAYVQGHNACRARLNVGACPYNDDEEARSYTAWIEGWNDANARRKYSGPNPIVYRILP